MYKYSVRWMIRRNVRALSRGEIDPLVSSYSHDAVLVFPGESSWGGRYEGRQAIEAFLRRFVDAGLEGEVHDILVNGPPWNTRVAVLFSDRAVEAGQPVYENRAMLYARAKWGKIVFQEDFEDTHRVEAFDEHLRQTNPDPQAGTASASTQS